jgi:hypothetical protein
MPTFYCLRFETPPTWRARSRIYIPQKLGGLVISPGTGFPFRHLLQLAELWYSTPPPHRERNTVCFEHLHNTVGWTKERTLTVTHKRHRRRPLLEKSSKYITAIARQQTLYCHILWVCVTNNEFWIGWLDLLTPSFMITLNYNQFTAHNQWLTKTRSIPYWTISVFFLVFLLLWLVWFWFTNYSFLVYEWRLTYEWLPNEWIQSSSLLPATSQHGHSWRRAPLGPMAIYLFSVKTFVFFFLSLFRLW